MQNTRAAAGKALLIFLVVMALLTLFSNTLQNMVVPVVSTTVPQRGALEKQIYADATLEASGFVPLVVADEARVTEIFVKTGTKVSAGEALLELDYGDVLKDRHAKLIEALNDAASKAQKYEWATADVSKDSVKTLETRRNSLVKGEEKLLAAQEALDALKEAGASKSELDKAERAVKSAQETVDYRRRLLEQMTSIRDYMTTGSELTSAMQALELAQRSYFDALKQLPECPADLDEDALIQQALRAVEFGGSATELIGFDPDAPHLLTVTAPVSGEVTAIDAKEGEIVNTGAPLMKLSDLSKGLSMTVLLSEDDAKLMAVGDLADVTVQGEVLSCEVVSVRASTESSGKYDVELMLPGGYGAVGLNASMRFKKRTQSYDVLVPLSALRQDNDGDYVLVVDQREGSLGASTTLQRVDVFELDRDSTRAALQGGLSGRDLVVTRGDREVADGDSVRLEGD